MCVHSSSGVNMKVILVEGFRELGDVAIRKAIKRNALTENSVESLRKSRDYLEAPKLLS